MRKERIKEKLKNKSLGYLIIVLLFVVAALVLCGIAFYFLGIMLPIALWQADHPVLAVLQFYVSFTSLIYGGSKS